MKAREEVIFVWDVYKSNVKPERGLLVLYLWFSFAFLRMVFV